MAITKKSDSKKKSFSDSAKETLQKVSDRLNPVKQFGGSADKVMKGARSNYQQRQNDRIDQKLRDAGARRTIKTKSKKV